MQSGGARTMKQAFLKILALSGVVTIGILFLLFSQQVR